MHARTLATTLAALAAGCIMAGCAGAKPSDLLTQTNAVETVPPVENIPVTGLDDQGTDTPLDTPPIVTVLPVEETTDGGAPSGRKLIAIYDYVGKRDTKDHFFSTDATKNIDGYTKPTRAAFYALMMAGPDSATLRQCDAIGGNILGSPHYLTITTCDLGGSGDTLGAAATKTGTIPGCNDVSIDLNTNNKKAWGFSPTSYEQGKCK